MGRKNSPFPTAGLVLVRLACGLVFVRQGWEWIATGTLHGAVVRAAVEDSLVHGRAWFEWWGRDVLLSNPDAIAFLFQWIALFAGVCLFLGALTRPAGVIAAFFLGNAWMFGPPSQRLLFLVLAVSCLACSIGRAGRRLGLDRMFDQHFPGWLTWSRDGKRSFLD